MDNFKKYCRKAEKLVEKLQEKVNKNPSTICENYGQKEIGKFMDGMQSLPYGTLNYMEECYIKNILYKVSSIH